MLEITVKDKICCFIGTNVGCGVTRQIDNENCIGKILFSEKYVCVNLYRVANNLKIDSEKYFNEES